MNRIGRLSFLICLMILASLLATGCENFTLIGSVNLGIDDVAATGADSVPDIIDAPNGVCWPPASKAFAEMVAHGFTPKKWPETEAWFRRLEAVKQQHVPCEPQK